MTGFCVTLLFLLCVAQESRSAERVDAKRFLQHMLQKRDMTSESVMPYRFKRHSAKLRMKELDDAMSLGSNTKLDVVQATRTVQGTQLIKLQEKYRGSTVPEGVVTLEMDTDGHHVLDASGSVFRDIDSDIGEESLLLREDALSICLRYNWDEYLQDDVTHVKVKEEVLFDDELNAYLTYMVQYLVLLEGDERRPTCRLNARDGQMITSWDALDSCSDCKATGVGGNLKIGKIRYGELQTCLNLRRENGTCYLENEYVRVINNNFTMMESDGDVESTPVASYNCEEIDDEVNGAFSPLLDALFFGTVVGKMFEEWYNMRPLGDTQITFRVHVGVNFTNAMWNGYECQFGDGADTFHPLISADIIGHEIGHGVTEKNSNLYYYQQWGGINEAFSDMAGETAEAYLGEADWVMGMDVSKNDNPLRFFENPARDNVSISHASEFTDYMNVHHSSGVYNRAFYLLVHEYGLPIKEVFHVFLHANQIYWHHMSDYVNAACDVMKSAYDLGQDGSKFRKAFEEVGVEVCDTEDHVQGLRNGKSHNNITVSEHISPSFVFGVPGQFSESITVNASSLHGDVYIVVSNETWDATEDGVLVYGEGQGFVQFEVPHNITIHLSVKLSTDSPTALTDVTLLASYSCVDEYILDYEDDSTFYMHMIWREYCEKGQEEEEEKDDDNEEPGEGSEHDKKCKTGEKHPPNP